MMVQYIEIKAANPDCLLFYRMGDFYEMFFEDAEIASRALGIVLTKRGRHLGEDIPMCGVPVERADDYLQRLIGLGHRVAVCEQTEDPSEAKKRGAKSVVARGVVRLVTPGTITEDRLLEPARANTLVALARMPCSDGTCIYGIAAADISTGAFSLAEAGETGLAAEIVRLDPREIVAEEALCEDLLLKRIVEDHRIALSPMRSRSANAQAAERRLCDFLGTATLDGIGAFSRIEIAAAATLVAYIERTQIAARPTLSLPTRIGSGKLLEIDAATRANLELTRTLGGTREGSLAHTIDFTVTPAGSRLLVERLASPSIDPSAIQRRLDAVEFLLAEPVLRADLRGLLEQLPDLARALSRIVLDRSGPRDLASLRDGLGIAAAVAARLAAAGPLGTELTEAAMAIAGIDDDLETRLKAALADELPLAKRDGGFVRAGFAAALDEARSLRDESRRVIASLQARYCEQIETRQLKIKHNNFLGFFIEVPQALGEKLLRPPFAQDFMHRQTMAEAMRFSTRELAELEAKIASAADRALGLEIEIFDRLARSAAERAEMIKAAAAALAVIDLSAALAELAGQRDWTRPQVDNSVAFSIVGGRHPVVEAALRAKGQAFIANDCVLADESRNAARIAVVTGPNMAGKSTYLRQNALIVVLAQMGSFVPAKRAEIGVVDRLFSRVGASDDLARGRSTFMVEMVETAAILNQAAPRSLVILDEIGRGTATFDGLSIAWAAVEHLHDKNRARALFATHFHELTQLARKLPRLVNLTMRVTEWKGAVVFLHEVVAGAADRSYGIQVAKLAGLPPSVVKRAQMLLAELEASERQAPVQKLIEDLPLFATLASPAVDPLREAVDALNPDAMTPREAHEALYDLRRISRAQG
ncbi:MAG TPA: DNA mismatch repair protein MutS [Beijerinckiaceae bacterium]|nr:DNA mismatch repair protein MutS [Beijerinckiaceae bacterium]